MPERHWIRSNRDRPKGRWASIYATLNPKGHLFITKHTFRQLGEPEAVYALWDKLNSTIGLEPTQPEEKDAYPLLTRFGHGGRVIRLYGFMQEFGVTIPETVRFTQAEINDEGILILDLRKVRSAAKPKKPKAGPPRD